MPIDGFDALNAVSRGLARLSEQFRGVAKERLATAREAERRLHRSIASLQCHLETHPDSEWVGLQLEQAQQELRLIEERRHEFSYHRQALQWTQLGDKVSGEFFALTSPRHSRTGVRRLQWPHGSCATEPDEIKGIATDFYCDLLSAKEPPPSREDCRQSVWMHTRKFVIDEMHVRLLAPVTLILRCLKPCKLCREIAALVRMVFSPPLCAIRTFLGPPWFRPSRE